jgi:hypothetical protein
MKTTLISDEPVKSDKKHLGNVKLSEAGKAIKIHVFETEKFLVIPLAEISKRELGRIYEYIEGEPEIVGEIIPPENGKKNYKLVINENIYFLKETYVQLLLKGSKLTLMLMEE